MFPTVEVRWFQQGQADSALRAWFRHVAHQAQEQTPRVDYYLRASNPDNLGIKLREGLVEIKEHHQTYGQVSFHQHVHGHVDGWRKWSFPQPETMPRVDSETFHQAWIGVKKERWLCLFRIRSETLEAVPLSTQPKAGCGLELTQVEASGETWWSVGLEAFGKEEENFERLLKVGKHIFAQDPPSFERPYSRSYPQWLATLERSSAAKRSPPSK